MKEKKRNHIILIVVNLSKERRRKNENVEFSWENQEKKILKQIVRKTKKKTKPKQNTKVQDNFVRMFELNRTKWIAKELNCNG